MLEIYGVELRRDDKGEIIFGKEGINVQELVLQSDGNYTLGENINSKEYVHYDSNNRTILLNFPDNSKGYKLTYNTEITGNPGPIKNYATLEGTDISFENTNSTYVISDLDVEASAKRAAKFITTIKDNEGNPIPNVEMVILTPEGNPIRQCISYKKGVVYFRALKPGNYILVQSKVPDGFVINENEIQLNIEQTSDGKFQIKIGNIPIENGNINLVNHSKNSVGSIKVSKNVVGENAILKSDEIIERSSNFILLSTCENTNENERIVIVGVS